MSRIEMSRNHDLSVKEARDRVKNLAGQLENEYGLRTSWDGDRLEFKRIGVKGAVFLEEGSVLVHVELSRLLSALKPKVEKRLRDGLEEEFGK